MMKRKYNICKQCYLATDGCERYMKQCFYHEEREESAVKAWNKRCEPEQEQKSREMTVDELKAMVGRTVYILTTDALRGYEETKIQRFGVWKNTVKLFAPCVHDDWGKSEWMKNITEIGKTIFFSQEEAKAALAGQEDR